jgi:hypothetical protein
VLRFLASLDDSAAAGRSLNPLLVHRIFECVNAPAGELTVDGVLARTAETLYTVNTRLRSLEGLRGQVLYALVEPLTENDSELVHTHFARFRTNHVVWLGADGLAAENRSFLPVPSFPYTDRRPGSPAYTGWELHWRQIWTSRSLQGATRPTGRHADCRCSIGTAARIAYGTQLVWLHRSPAGPVG